MINIVIPAAGAGSRFAREGFSEAKPFIDVLGKAMIVRVLENLACEGANFIIILRKEHLQAKKELCESIKKDFNALFIGIDKLTEGTACTVLFAREFINNDVPLLIANSDQIVDLNLQDFIKDCEKRRLDGSLLCFEDSKQDSKWSFVRLQNELVVEVREKQAISKFATVGIYLFTQGKIFVDSALQMILENDRVNNEFYTAPAYNYAIKQGFKFGIYNIKEEQMHGLGTPEDLKTYLELKNARI